MIEPTILEGKAPPSRMELPCTTCGAPMSFVNWLTKPGRNGKPSIWPQYAGCSNPECRVGGRNLGVSIPEDVNSSVGAGRYEPDHNHKPGWRGRLYQFPGGSSLQSEISKWDKKPSRVIISTPDYVEWGSPSYLDIDGEQVGVSAVSGITPGYRYFVVPFEEDADGQSD